jgi:hypothetical protein
MQAILKGTLGPALVLIGLGIRGALLGYVLALATAGLTGASVLFFRREGIRVKVMNPTDAMRLSSRSRQSSYAAYSDPTTFLASGELRVLLGYGLPLYVAAILSVFLTQYQSVVNQRSQLARGFVLAVKYTSLLMIPASLAVMIFSRDLIYLTYDGGYTFAPRFLVLLSALYPTRLQQSMGIRQTSAKYCAGPDLRAGGRILLAAFVAGVPTIALIQLDRLGVGAVNLIVGGLLYVLVYVTLIPALGAVSNQDILNLRTLLGTRVVAKLVNPVFSYESKLLSRIRLNRWHFK